MKFKKCKTCNLEFEVKSNNINQVKYCSDYCKYKNKLNNSIKCQTNCHVCNMIIFKTKAQIKKSKSGNLFCGNKCVGKYNSLIKSDNLKKNCIICNEEFKCKKSTYDKQITCSNKCQGLWQSKFRTGENSSNYKGGGVTLICHNCDNEFKSSRPNRINSKFCSRECKHKYWVENTLNSEEFAKARYEGNLKYRSIKRETLPEKLVREYLNQLNLVDNVDFIQECGFFRKYFADFFIIKGKIIIEVMGDYWHGNPQVYNENQLNDSQKNRIELDKIKKKEFIDRGFTYIEIWEKDIYENIELAMSTIPLNDYTQNNLS